MLEIVVKLFEKWNADICYCHWKSNEHLVEGLNGITDLDLLISFDDKSKAEAILKGDGFLFCKSQFGSRYPKVDDWIGFDDATGMLVHLHIHYNIITGHRGLKEYNLPWSDEALKTRVYDDNTGVFVINPSLELLTLYTRIGLKASPKKIHLAKRDKFILDDDILVEILYLKKLFDVDSLRHYLNIYYKSYSDEMFSLIMEENINSRIFLNLVKVTEKAMKPYCRYSYCYLKILQYYYLLALRVRRILRSKGKCLVVKKVPYQERGLCVAFLGQDGSGKSTVTKEIQKWLSWKFDAERFYMGSGDGFSTWERTLLRRLPRNSVLAPIRALLHLSKTLSVASKRVNKQRIAKKLANKGVIIIYDRFPQLSFPAINDGAYIRELWMPLVKNKFLRSIIKKLASIEEKKIKIVCQNEPDIVFKLVLPVEESMKRKPGENVDLVKRKHNIISSLSFCKSDVHEIDATQPYIEEILKIKRIIWNHIPKS